MTFDYDKLIKRIKSLDEEEMTEGFLHDSGRKEKLELTKIYRKYKDVFSLNNFKEVRKLFDKETDFWKRRRYRLCLNYLSGSIVGNAVVKLSEKESDLECKSYITFDGKKIFYREIHTVVHNEPDRKVRDKINDLEIPIKKKITRINKEAIDKKLKIIKSLGFKDYVSYNSTLKDVDYFKLGEQLSDFLRKTDKITTEVQRKNMDSIGVDLKDAKQHDMLWFMRSKEFDRYFPKERLLPVLVSTLKGLGFDINNQKNIEIDLEPRKHKSPRAFCAPIKIPEEVKLVTKPHGGQDDYGTILHEAGHTEHYANTLKDLEFELKHLGDHTVSESYAFLFEYLTLNKHWLEKYIGMPKNVVEKFLDVSMRIKLAFFRRYVGKLLYELKLFTNDLRVLDGNFRPTSKRKYKNFAECYADVMTKATKINYQTHNYLIDLDPGFYSADYLRAWLLEIQTRKFLEQKFGKNWFENKSAGKFIKDHLFAYANKYTVYEVAQHLGYNDLDISYTTDEYLEFFRK